MRFSFLLWMLLMSARASRDEVREPNPIVWNCKAIAGKGGEGFDRKLAFCQITLPDQI